MTLNASQLGKLIGRRITFTWLNVEKSGRVLSVRTYAWMDPEEYEVVAQVSGEGNYTIPAADLLSFAGVRLESA